MRAWHLGPKCRPQPSSKNDVRDAQKLLRYASEDGKKLSDGAIPAIIHAQVALQEKDVLTEKTIIDFYTAYTVLGLAEKLLRQGGCWLGEMV